MRLKAGLSMRAFGWTQECKLTYEPTNHPQWLTSCISHLGGQRRLSSGNFAFGLSTRHNVEKHDNVAIIYVWEPGRSHNRSNSRNWNYPPVCEHYKQSSSESRIESGTFKLRWRSANHSALMYSENNIKIHGGGTCFECKNWIKVPQDKVHWRICVNFRVP